MMTNYHKLLEAVKQFIFYKEAHKEDNCYYSDEYDYLEQVFQVLQGEVNDD